MGAQVDSTEDFVTRLKRLKALKALPVFGLVEGKILAFQQSLPLIENLKNDALRKRHWEKLMEVTGARFDMDPKTFTLSGLFAMQLHNFSDMISDITNAAVKELTIESELRKLTEARAGDGGMWGCGA